MFDFSCKILMKVEPLFRGQQVCLYCSPTICSLLIAGKCKNMVLAIKDVTILLVGGGKVCAAVYRPTSSDIAD